MRLTPQIVLVPVAAVIGFLLLFDTLSPSTASPVPSPVVADQAVSGSWYCAAGDTNEGRTTAVVFAPVPGEQPAPTDVLVSTFGEGRNEPGSETRVLPEDVRVDELPSGRSSIGVSARWWGRPAVLSRVWRVGGSEFPSGWVAGPCESTPSANWYLPGLSTDGGGEARLILANPFEGDATATVTLATPEGRLQPRRLENLHVANHSVLRIVLNEFAPEQADLAVIVHVRAGRLVSEGVQSFNAAIGGVDGVTLVKAAPATALRWTIPWLEVADRVGEDEEGDQDGVESWLWIANPSDEAADVQINLHTPQGAAPPGLGGEGGAAPTEGDLSLESLQVEPGSVLRLDVADLLPGGAGVAGVTIESTNEVPIVASAATVRRDPAAALSALAIQLGAPRGDPTWVWSVPPPVDRTTHLHVVNLGEAPASLDVRYHTGEGQLVTLDRELTVPAGALLDVDLTGAVGDASQLTVYVSSDQPIVAGYRSLNIEGRPDLVVGLGASSITWQGGGQVPTALHRPELVRQLGTGDQPSPDPAGTPTSDPSPTPVPSPAPTVPAGPSPTAPSSPPETGSPPDGSDSTDAP